MYLYQPKCDIAARDSISSRHAFGLGKEVRLLAACVGSVLGATGATGNHDDDRFVHYLTNANENNETEKKGFMAKTAGAYKATMESILSSQKKFKSHSLLLCHLLPRTCLRLRARR